MIKRANFDDKSYQLLSSNLHQFIIKVRSIHYRTSLVSSTKQMESFVKDCQEVSQSLWVCLTSCWVLLDFMVSFRAKLTTKACKTRYQVMQNRTPDSAHQVACSCLLKSGQPQGYINRWTVTKKSQIWINEKNWVFLEAWLFTVINTTITVVSSATSKQAPRVFHVPYPLHHT